MTKNYWEWNDDTQNTMTRSMTAKDWARLVGEDGNGSTVEEVLIGFATMHVQAALMAAHKSAVWELDGRAWDRVYNKRFLLQAYPADKIK